MAEDHQRISVSHSLLRAELAEMELRLRIYFDEQLKHKQDSTPFVELASRFDALDRGDFSPVHKRALQEFIDDAQRNREDRGWTARERIFGVVAILVAVASFALSVYVGLAAASRSTPTPPATTTSEVHP